MRAMRRSLPTVLALLFALFGEAVGGTKGSCAALKSSFETKLDCCQPAGSGNSRCDTLHARYADKGCPEILCAIECNDDRDPENPAVCDGYTHYCCNDSCGMCAPLDAVCPPDFCGP